MARWNEHPDLHVYHYAPYEPAALKRLLGRYATREEEIDQMLRAHLFVDLYGVVRQGLRASVESYSIKKLEPFYDFTRATDLQNARLALETGTEAAGRAHPKPGRNHPRRRPAPDEAPRRGHLPDPGTSRRRENLYGRAHDLRIG
jgi:uncharacterized protein